MMRGSDALSVGGGGAVVEVGGVTVSHLSTGAEANLGRNTGVKTHHLESISVSPSLASWALWL